MGLGLAIGSDALRACRATPWWGRLWLRWRGAAALPRDLVAASPRDENIASLGRFREVLSDVFRHRWLLGGVRVGLPEPSARVRLLLTEDLPEDPAGRRKYLLWRLADALDFTPERTRLAHMVLPSPLPRWRHAVLCAVTGAKVMEQYERALSESGLRYSGITPSSIPLFNLVQDRLAEPPDRPVLLLAATEVSSTAVVTVGGCPVFWRTHRAVGPGPEAPTGPARWRGELLRDARDAILYTGEQLGVAPPARIVVTGPPAEDPGLAPWLAAHLKVPVDAVDPGRLVRPFPHAHPGSDWNRWEVALGAAAHRPLPPAPGPQRHNPGPTQRQDTIGEEPLAPRLDPADAGAPRPLPRPPGPPAAPPDGAAGDTHVHAPAVVGNKRSKIYHLPGGRFYERMARTSKHKICFASAAQAEQAGYRRSKR